MIDIKTLNIPNVCFSLTDANDNREEEFKKQRMERGFDDSETWSLRDTFANFMLPRLKRFKEIYTERVLDDRNLMGQVDQIILAFELVVRDQGAFILTDDEYDQFDDGMRIFSNIFLKLWW